jgi:hypothetical protein
LKSTSAAGGLRTAGLLNGFSEAHPDSVTKTIIPANLTALCIFFL